MEIFEKYKKQIIIMLVAIGIPVLIILVYSLFNQKDVKNAKTENGSSLPQVNVSSNNADALNSHIQYLYEEYTKDGKSKFNYTYEKYNDIISILITIDQYDQYNDSYVRKYIGFNIDKDGSYLTIEDLCEQFGYDILEIKQKVDERLQVYYKEEAELGYFESNEMDYDGYLSYMRNIDSVIDNVSLVIENKKLVAYINLSIDSFSDDEEYFNNLNYDPYKIIIE